jgi:iron complex outermembrane receptor protein
MKRRLLVLALLVLSSQVSKAQKSQKVEDSLRVEQLEEVTIRAIRAAQDAPVAQVTVNRKTIEKQFYGQDGAFLLEKLSPSLVSYSESGTGLSNYGQMRLRGIDQTRINMTLNGVPLNDMMDQGVFFSNFTDFGNSIESVQIQRGVGTSSNGVSSYAGSINFESISLANAKPSAELQFTGGAFNTIRASAEVSTGLQKNRTAFYARLSRVQSDGYRYNTSTASNSLFFSGAYFGKKHAFKFTGFAGQSQNGLGYTPVSLAQIQVDPRTNVVSENDIDNFGQYLFQLQHTYRIGSKSSLVSTVYHGGAGGDFPFGYDDENGAFTQINYPLYNSHWGLMSNYSINMESAGDFTLGLHAYTFNRRNVEYIIPNRNAPYYEDESTKNEVAVFAKWEKDFSLGSSESENLKIFADVQLRQLELALGADQDFLGEEPAIASRNYTFLNPKLGISYQLNRAWQLYASYGRTGREPTRFDILGAVSVSAANIDLARGINSVQAEYVNDLEFGTRWNTESVSLQLNLFYMQFENEIAPIGEYITEGFVQVFLNQQASSRQGIELNGNWDISNTFVNRPNILSLSGQISLLQAEISSYRPAGSDMEYTNISPILSPQVNGQLNLSYQASEKFNFGIGARYLGEQFMELTNNPDLTVPSSLVLNLNANWNFYKEHGISVQVNNLTNELYYTYGAPDFTGGPAYFVQAPLHAYATLRLVF